MVYKLIYLLVQRFIGKKGPVAIKVDGELRGAIIEDNVSVGLPLLDANKVKDSLIRRNLTYLPAPKDIHWIWKSLLDFVVILIVAFLVYKFGWN